MTRAQEPSCRCRCGRITPTVPASSTRHARCRGPPTPRPHAVSTSGAHSGYYVFGAEEHDRHHEFFDYNFGVSVFMDKLLGTSFEGSKLDLSLRAKRAQPWHDKLE